MHMAVSSHMSTCLYKYSQPCLHACLHTCVCTAAQQQSSGSPYALSPSEASHGRYGKAAYTAVQPERVVDVIHQDEVQPAEIELPRQFHGYSETDLKRWFEVEQGILPRELNGFVRPIWKLKALAGYISDGCSLVEAKELLSAELLSTAPLLT